MINSHGFKLIDNESNTCLKSILADKLKHHYKNIESYLSDECVISGSTLLSSLVNKEFESDDIDIYINNSVTSINHPLLVYLNEYMESDKIINNYNRISHYTPGYHRRTDLFDRNIFKYNRFYFEYNNTRLKIDIIITYDSPIKYIKNHFDLNLVKNYYNGIFIYSLNYDDIINKIEKTNKIPIGQGLIRYKKYINRGFKIYLKGILIDDNLLDNSDIQSFYKNLTPKTEYIKKNIICEEFFEKSDIQTFQKFLTLKKEYMKEINICKFGKNKLNEYNLRLFKLKFYQKIIRNQFKKKRLVKNLKKYSEYCLKLYLYPGSPFMEFSADNWDIVEDKKNNQMIYVNNNNKIKILKFK